MPSLLKIRSGLNKIELVAIGVLALTSLLVSLYAIIARYLAPEYAADWTTEAVVYLITWSFFLAGSRAVLNADHVKADLLTSLLPLKVRRYLTLVQDTFAVLFCGLLLVGGLQVVQLSLRLNERSDSSVALPMWVYYSCFPLAMASLSCRYAFRILTSLERFQRPGTDESENSN